MLAMGKVLRQSLVDMLGDSGLKLVEDLGQLVHGNGYRRRIGFGWRKG